MTTHCKENTVNLELVKGIGFNDRKSPVSVGGRHTKEYALWNSVLHRCTEKFWLDRPTYKGTTCSENFKSYSFFYKWCQTQIGFGNKDENGRSWHLDKDILLKGNNIYSDDTCVFVPARINTLLIKCDASRGDWPVGVFWDKKRGMFKAQSRDGNSKKKHLGCFKTLEESFKAYKTFKEAVIKEVANEYKDQLDPRAYQALLNYEVNENV